MVNNELSPEQLGAIRRSIRLGRTLQKDYPEIAIMFKEGHSYHQIAETLLIIN